MAVELKNERGTTLIELMVGLAAGMVVLAALSMVLITTMRGSARVTARVEATQRARVVLTRITEELHSACTTPQIAPILGQSNGSRLEFTHAVGAEASAVAPKPTRTAIYFENGTLKQKDTPWKSGSYPNWDWDEAQARTTTLLTKVAPVTPGADVFTYSKFSSGALVAPPQTLNGEGAYQLGEEARSVIAVQVALDATPLNRSVVDPGADSSIQDSAVLRLTPPRFESSGALPCQ